jgi:hypothetical protein
VRDVAASQGFQLDSSEIEEIASRIGDAIVERVAQVIMTEGLIPTAPATTAWLDAQEVARRLGVSRDWVYEHADELGASRIGSGPRPRLRFPPEILDQRSTKLTPAEATSEAPKRRSKPGGLIPIRGS